MKHVLAVAQMLRETSNMKSFKLSQHSHWDFHVTLLDWRLKKLFMVQTDGLYETPCDRTMDIVFKLFTPRFGSCLLLAWQSPPMLIIITVIKSENNIWDDCTAATPNNSKEWKQNRLLHSLTNFSLLFSYYRSCYGGLGHHKPQRRDWIWTASRGKDEVFGLCCTSLHSVPAVPGNFLSQCPIQSGPTYTAHLSKKICWENKTYSELSCMGMQLSFWAAHLDY